MKKPLAIIFDLDGVLLFSLELHEKAFRETFEGLELSKFCYKDITGMRTDEAIQKVFDLHKRSLSESQLKELTASKQKTTQRLLKELRPLDPDAPEMLKNLASRYIVALASSASVETVNLFLEWSQSRDVFKAIVNGRDVKEAKPSPLIYQLAAEKIGISPSDCLVIEDAPAGIESAIRAGCQVFIRECALGFPDEYLKHPQVVGKFTHLQEIEKYLGQF
jgi:beta-phosphoglucomutase